MAQKTLWWIVGIVVVVLLGMWGWSRSNTQDDMATTTASTTADIASTTTTMTTTKSGTAATAGAVAKAPGNLPSGNYALDTEVSTLTWSGNKPKILGYEDTGTVKLKNGTIKVVDGNIVSGEFFIDMDSIAVTKTSNTKAGAEMLVSHLKSDDFFGVAKHPNAHFVIKNVTNGTVTGELTVKDITKTISFPATITTDGGAQLRAKADIILNRANWDIRYGSGSFFDNLGDNLIADQVKISLDLVAKK